MSGEYVRSERGPSQSSRMVSPQGVSRRRLDNGFLCIASVATILSVPLLFVTAPSRDDAVQNVEGGLEMQKRHGKNSRKVRRCSFR